MVRRHVDIPGHYYDIEKNKYFKIQANHIAPPNAKYSTANVNRERRDNKRRRAEDRTRKVRARQTVTIAESLRHSLLGKCGLLRESGLVPGPGASHEWRNAAFVDGLELKMRHVDLPGYDGYSHQRPSISLVDARFMPENSSMLLAVTHSPHSHALYCVPCKDPLASPAIPREIEPFNAFHDRPTSIDTFEYAGVPYVVTCISEPSHTGNVYVDRLPDPHAPDSDASFESSLALHGAGRRIAASRLHAASHQLALLGEDRVWVRDLRHAEATVGQCKIRKELDYFAMDWLNERTLALAVPQHVTNPTTVKHNVHLWDLRAHDTAVRFRRTIRVTGIETIDAQHMLVASSRQMDVYDLRRGDRPLLTIPHSSGGSELPISIFNGLVSTLR